MNICLCLRNNINLVGGVVLMKQRSHYCCPKCCSEEFVTEPNCYDILKFINSKFETMKKEMVERESIIRCRECGIKINEKASIRNGKIVLT